MSKTTAAAGMTKHMSMFKQEMTRLRHLYKQDSTKDLLHAPPPSKTTLTKPNSISILKTINTYKHKQNPKKTNPNAMHSLYQMTYRELNEYYENRRLKKLERFQLLKSQQEQKTTLALKLLYQAAQDFITYKNMDEKITACLSRVPKEFSSIPAMMETRMKASAQFENSEETTVSAYQEMMDRKYQASTMTETTFAEMEDLEENPVSAHQAMMDRKNQASTNRDLSQS